LHRAHIEKTLHRQDVIEKSRKTRQGKEFRAKMSQRMQQPETQQILSAQAKEQWQDEAYQSYMLGKWREFYDNNQTYRQENHKRLNQAQQDYWSDEANRLAQSQRVSAYFANNPQARETQSLLAKEQWENEALLAWRREKTQQQWTPEFRAQRHATLQQTYYRKTIAVLKQIEIEQGKVDVETYNSYRKQTKDKSLLRFDNFCQRYFDGNPALAYEAVANYNHRIVSIERLAEQVCSQPTQIFNAPKAIAPKLEDHNHSATIQQIKSGIQNLSWQAAGICRVQSDLEIALIQISAWQTELAELAEPSRLWIETRNLADYAYLLMRSALFRTESRGAHYRADFPDTDPSWQLHTIIEGQEIRRSPALF
jgi:hypothetical protein